MNEIVEEWYQFDIFLNMLTHYEELDEKIGSALSMKQQPRDD